MSVSRHSAIVERNYFFWFVRHAKKLLKNIPKNIIKKYGSVLRLPYQKKGLYSIYRKVYILYYFKIFMDDDEKIDVLFGTEEESAWLKFREAREASIKQLKESLMIEKELLKLAQRKTKQLNM